MSTEVVNQPPATESTEENTTTPTVVDTPPTVNENLDTLIKREEMRVLESKKNIALYRSMKRDHKKEVTDAGKKSRLKKKS